MRGGQRARHGLSLLLTVMQTVGILPVIGGI
jgi:hypothetical protein